jgi:homoserine kinase
VRLTVRVPATSANLGPGFDSFGLALDLCNDVTIDTELTGVAWEGQGADELPTDGTDMVSRAIAHVAAGFGVPLPSFGLRGVNLIPLERGLGSSAAAAVAGVALGIRLLGLDDRSMATEGGVEVATLGLATEIEGHPDNAAPATLGGLTLAFATQEGPWATRFDLAPGLRAVALVPTGARIATIEARRALAATVPLEDAVFNASHAALAMMALTSRPDLLVVALDDRLHQGARLAGVPDVASTFAALRDAGVAVCVSGSGPTLLAFEGPGLPAVPDLGGGWDVLRLAVHPTGAEIIDP